MEKKRGRSCPDRERQERGRRPWKVQLEELALGWSLGTLASYKKGGGAMEGHCCCPRWREGRGIMEEEGIALLLLAGEEEGEGWRLGRMDQGEVELWGYCLLLSFREEDAMGGGRLLPACGLRGGEEEQRVAAVEFWGERRAKCRKRKERIDIYSWLLGLGID